MDSRDEQQLASMEMQYDYIRGSHFCQDTDNLITKKNLAYAPTHVKMIQNVAYRNKTAGHYHNPLTESLLQSDEYAYVSQYT